MESNPKPDWDSALRRARDYAPFLARALDRQEPLADLLARGESEAALEWTRARGDDADIDVGLRRHRLGLATTLAIGDLAGAFSLSDVVGELSRFADYALDRAIRTAIEERTGEATGTGMIGLALGKQGAGELNYSSDIDPILLFDPDNLPHRAKDDPGEAAQRYARRVVKLLSENTGEGYVLRVDLRLRPASEISPLAVPMASALTHYQGQALAWERAAFIRARAAAGDVVAGEAFLAEIAPFIWRQALDFGAIEEIRALTARIRQDHDGPMTPGPGFDVKKGRGGIREIEFYAQTHQLIHGGRDPSLRVRGTRAALDALAASGWIEADEARILGEGYDRLRTVEHRIQMVNDRQTHALPEGKALDNLARLDGLENGEALVEELRKLTSETARIYAKLIEKNPKKRKNTEKTPKTEAKSAVASPDSSAELTAKFAEWRDGRFAAIRSPQALELFDQLTPKMLTAFAQSDDPMRAATRWQNILERSQSALNLFHLLLARPHLLDRLVATLTLSPLLADELGRRPELLDALLDSENFDMAGLYNSSLEAMRSGPVRDDYEAQLDRIRQVVGEQRFLLGVGLVEADYRPAQIGAALSVTAEAAISRAVETTRAEFVKVHGTVPGGELVVLGLGRLGGGALTHMSDLDMIYLFTGEYSSESDGERPLGATRYFNRLASRVSAALSVPTAQGALYEVDTRLRPQGKQGPLVVSFDAFAKYQREQAWTWEHMALARARVLVGSDRARRAVEAIVRDVLQTARDSKELRKAVLDMREEMAKHKPARGLLDVKLARGGLIDVEFLVHFLQLDNAASLAEAHPSILSPDLMGAIKGLVACGLLPEELTETYDLLTALLVAGRLLIPDGKEPPVFAAQALARACGRPSYEALLDDLAKARKCVAKCWADIFETELEIE